MTDRGGDAVAGDDVTSDAAIGAEPTPHPAGPAPAPADPAGAAPRWRREVRAFAELFALNGFAIAQPLLDIFGKAPDQFIYRGADRGDIIAFALLVTLALPVGCWAVEALVGLASTRARDVVHRVALFGFAAVLLVIVTGGFLPRRGAIVAGLVGAGLAVLAYARTRGPRLWLAFASPAPIAFLAVFLLGSQVAPLLRAPAGALATTVRTPTPTVVLVLDEFPLDALLAADGTVDADLYPNVGRLAATSTWFRQTTTVANFTSLAVPAILTGKVPDGNRAATSADHPESLFTLLGDAMPVTASEVVTSLCPPSLCESIGRPTGSLRALLRDARAVLAQRLDPDDDAPDPFAGFAEDDAAGSGEPKLRPSDLDRFTEFLDELGEDPTGLHLVHLLLPHAPHRFLPDGSSYPVPEVDPARYIDRWSDEETAVDSARIRFLLQLQWVDVLVGRLLDRLEEAGTFDDTNVVVVADHGAGFSPGGSMRVYCPSGADCPGDVDDATLAQILWVPFFVKRAGQRDGEISDAPVRNVDVTPTIADLLDVDLPWDADGRSAYEGGSGDPDEATLVFAEMGPNGAQAGPSRTLDRDVGWRFLRGHAAGTFAPADGASGADRLFRRGPRPDLWGEPVPAELTELDWEPIRYDASDVDLASRVVPAHFQARVPGAGAGRAVAIAVDGTVWATARTYADGLVVALLPTRAFHDGDNEVTLYGLP